MLVVQINGHRQGTAQLAGRSRLFEEPYDQFAPEPGRSGDFDVRGEALRFATNEIAVLSAAPITVTNIEFAVTR